MLNLNARTLIIGALALTSLGLLACSSTPEPAASPTAPAVVVQSNPSPTSAPAAPAASGEMSWNNPPAMDIDTSKDYKAVVELEKGGEFTIQLYAEEAPNTVNSFVFLSRQGFYDGVTFHRVIEGFMAQGGDRNGRPLGTGDPGYKYDNEITPSLHHDTPGTLSMANSGVRNGSGTNGSQFFITFVPTPFLDSHVDEHNIEGFGVDKADYDPSIHKKDCNSPGTSCHTVFGKVIEGMDVVNGLSIRDPNTATTPGDAIKTITINES